MHSFCAIDLKRVQCVDGGLRLLVLVWPFFRHGCRLVGHDTVPWLAERFRALGESRSLFSRAAVR